MPPPLGDFEPPLDVLDLLVSSDLIKEDLNMELDVDPVTTLLNYELARVKPAPTDAPTPPAAPPRQRKKKGKKDKKSEAERIKASKEAKERESAAARAAELDKEDEEEAERVRTATAAMIGDEENGELDDLEKERRRELYASLDAPRTRGAMAAAAAFEAEAHGSTPISGSSSISIPASAGPSRPPDSTDKTHWKRPSITSMSQTSIPRVVNDVDNRDSFSMFNAGWILPPDQKRGGRVPADRPALPPPRKRQKTGSSP
jgi:NuA3 HAT complex component NTO1